MRGVEWRRGSESNRRIKVLQTSPLPFGYRALQLPKFSLTSGNSPSDGKALAGAGLGPEFWSTTRNQFKPIGEAPIPANQFSASGDFGPCCVISRCSSSQHGSYS